MFWRKKKPEKQQPRLTPWTAPPSGNGGGFLVSGVTFRQSALIAAGLGEHQFALIREPSNVHDPHAVAVLAKGHHIGYISAKMAARYCEAINRLYLTNRLLYVHGEIRKDKPINGGGYYAHIDCCWPEDIT